jgi:hypothetical protein
MPGVVRIELKLTPVLRGLADTIRKSIEKTLEKELGR